MRACGHRFRQARGAFVVLGCWLVIAACGAGSDAGQAVTPVAATANAAESVAVATTAPLVVDDGAEVEIPLAEGAAMIETVEAPLACLSTRQQAAQLLLALLTEPELAAATEMAGQGELSNIGLLGSPGSGLADGLASMRAASALPMLVASDEEGGSVQRLAGLLGAVPPAATQAATVSLEDLRDLWAGYGTQLNEIGIDVVFAPVLDVGSAPGILSRSFGDDPEVVTNNARAVARGLVDAGVQPVFKHFPGHGRATADSHERLPSTPPLNELRTWDLLPYDALLNDPELAPHSAVMIGHLAVPGLSGDVPTSLSPETINGLLRSEIGFDGLVYTDALNMGAIVNTYGAVQAIELSLRAGVDIVILGGLADVTPALDHLETVTASDPAFADLVRSKAQRVLEAKSAGDPCT